MLVKPVRKQGDCKLVANVWIYEIILATGYTCLTAAQPRTRVEPEGGGGGGGDGVNSTNFYAGRLRTEVQRLNLLYTLLGRKGTPFV